MKPYRAMRTTRNIQNLQRSLPGWYHIKNAEPGLPTQITIYEEIGFLGVAADQFMQSLAGIDGDIEMHINSPGGDVHAGIAIYNQLKQRKGTVAVVVDGIAASAASFIAQAATPGHLAMSPHSQMMIHDGFGMTIGNAEDMRHMADLLDKASDNIAGIYADRTGKPAAYWRDKMRAETWLNDHEAVAEGLADYVVGQEPASNKWNLAVYDHAPALVNADGNHAPMTGSHSHSHADGDGDMHTHEHAHDGDASHADHAHAEPDGDEDGAPPWAENALYARIWNAKYNQADRDRMAGNGQAMPDGSYPIADEEDLHNAIRAVGRGGADHDSIRRHVIKRARAMGKADQIPDNWNGDGSLKTSADNLSVAEIRAMFGGELSSSVAGRS